MFALPPRPDAPAVGDESPTTAAIVGNVLRYALGLSAWKQFGGSRWSLRVNPSSGNLHPTEAYVVAGAVTGLSETAAVYHYAPDRHELELRCGFDSASWPAAVADPGAWLVAFTSIHWREAWKYGERAFRYCQHDLGHAIAAVRIAADLVGWKAAIVPAWSHGDIAALTGIDRAGDFVDAEREEPGCVLVVSSPQSGVPSRESPVGSPQSAVVSCDRLVAAVRRGQWTGRANQLSEDHVEWTFIDEIARATEDSGHAPITPLPTPSFNRSAPAYPAGLLLERRSAVSLDGRSPIDAAHFFAMLARVMPCDGPPWDALWWDARMHLALFVHRVDGIEPGLYLLPRNRSAVDRLKAAVRQDFSWEPVSARVPLVRLARGDYRRLAQRVSCDQEIAADGFFSLGMIADFDASLEAFGPSFYRQLFWEAGAVGQVLYLEAEAAGARATGIGCFYDDPVHDVFGFRDHAFQSLYHFTVGIPVEDTRLTTAPGYSWDTEPIPPTQVPATDHRLPDENIDRDAELLRELTR